MFTISRWFASFQLFATSLDAPSLWKNPNAKSTNYVKIDMQKRVSESMYDQAHALFTSNCEYPNILSDTGQVNSTLDCLVTFKVFLNHKNAGLVSSHPIFRN